MTVVLIFFICRGFRWSFWFAGGFADLFDLMRVTLIFLICSGLHWSFLICWGLCWSFRFAEGYADHLSLPFTVGAAGEESRGTEHLVQLNAPMSFVEGEEIYKVLLMFTKPAECFRRKKFFFSLFVSDGQIRLQQAYQSNPIMMKAWLPVILVPLWFRNYRCCQLFQPWLDLSCQ